MAADVTDGQRRTDGSHDPLDSGGQMGTACASVAGARDAGGQWGEAAPGADPIAAGDVPLVSF